MRKLSGTVLFAVLVLSCILLSAGQARPAPENEEIHFFTAVPVHLHRQDPKAVLRHRKAADMSFRIRANRYAHHQLPDPVVVPGGELIRKPREW